ncbi:glycosyltransferase [Microbacterium betulae]|uniref:Glycosyltransferase n=1 Tax=Microbacterium betulae TaxID=2981139 RepID=A0AA97FHH4_9MICO|nr:glycosyltransferase [Microbacterium sp. AB]WOF22639.1 glycosyltransferase [Microbacterium sp. AB]
MPRLAVLMPAFDAARTIERAVRSTLADLPADAELVVADDGSTDDTLAVLDRIADRRLRVVTGPNRGVARTLNRLRGITDSSFVARMDADDVVLPGRFARQLRALGDADAVFTAVVTARDGAPRPSAPRPSWPRGIAPAAFPFHLLLTNPVAHSTLAARRSALDAAGDYRTVPSEDYDLWLRLAARGARMRRLALPGVLYRVHDGQVTAASGWRLASWHDEKTQNAFAVLSAQLLGEPRQRISSLAAAPLSRAARLARLAEFERLFRAAVAPLGLADRRVLLRRLRQRAQWLRQHADGVAASSEALARDAR